MPVWLVTGIAFAALFTYALFERRRWNRALEPSARAQAPGRKGSSSPVRDLPRRRISRGPKGPLRKTA